MSGALDHSPADIVAQLLVDLSLGSDPTGSSAWPVFVAREPETPDNCITVFGTASKKQGRTMNDGEVQEQHGIQVSVRSGTYPTGFAKARAIAVALDESVRLNTVSLESATYTVYGVSRTSGPLDLGKEPTTKRNVFTINATVTLRQSS